MEMINMINKAVSYASKFGDAELRITKEEETEVIFENESLKNLNAGENYGLSVRVAKNKRFGYAQTTDLSKWRECVDSAVKLMKVNEPLLVKPRLSRTRLARGFNAGFELKEVSDDELINNALLIIKGAKEVSEKILVSSAGISINSIETRFINSVGSDASYTKRLINSEVQCVSGRSSGFDCRTSRRLNIDFKSLGDSAAKLCIKSINPNKVSSQKADLTIDYLGLIQLLDLLSNSLLASNVLENKSVFKGRVGECILSSKVSITDDATLALGIASQPFDAEGTNSKRAELITNGVLNGFLHDNYTAKRMRTNSTGNCAGLATRPSVSYNNLIIKEGRASDEELLNDCFYTHSLMGAHMANQVSGDFALNLLNAFRIENDEWIPIRDAMVSGNLFNLWNNVKAVGKELRMDSSIITPKVKFGNVQIVA